jgi:hypothetical protein
VIVALKKGWLADQFAWLCRFDEFSLDVGEKLLRRIEKKVRLTKLERSYVSEALHAKDYGRKTTKEAVERNLFLHAHKKYEEDDYGSMQDYLAECDKPDCRCHEPGGLR